MTLYMAMEGRKTPHYISIPHHYSQFKGYKLLQGYFCAAKRTARFMFSFDVSFLIYFNSQSLVNLLVTGHAVSNVWDGDRECSGMSKTPEKLLQTHTYTHTKHSIQFMHIL